MRTTILPRRNKNNKQIRAYGSAVRRGSKSQHVIRQDGGWAVKQAGAIRPSRVFDTQEKAIKSAKKMAKKQKTDLFVHNRVGFIRDRFSY